MRKPPIIATPLMPRRQFSAITLFGVVFTPKNVKLSAKTINHEHIHCRQQLEWLYIPFFIIYFFEWLWLWIKTGDRMKAYRNISFEREAYNNESNPDYLLHRPIFATFRRRKPKKK